ncbi:transcription termination factor 2 isoform X2 [Amia ocellicauda]|uniref:transcription termination factor 2 isoform X2 n=1 Tax=Amia ocellicauda TaxID=2972642 RepID=UPI003464980F
MEKVICDRHGNTCLLKTGVREGPNKGKSFYLCRAKHGESCDFNKPADIPPSHCLHHEDSLVELQALVKHEDQQCYRLFFRCVTGKADGKKWCGNVPWQKKEEKSRHPSKAEFTQHPQERNPFKAQNKPEKPSDWKVLRECGSVSGEGDKENGSSTQSSEVRRAKQLPAGMKIKSRSSDEAQNCSKTSKENVGVENKTASGIERQGEHLKKEKTSTTGDRNRTDKSEKPNMHLNLAAQQNQDRERQPKHLTEVKSSSQDSETQRLKDSSKKERKSDQDKGCKSASVRKELASQQGGTSEDERKGEICTSEVKGIISKESPRTKGVQQEEAGRLQGKPVEDCSNGKPCAGQATATVKPAEEKVVEKADDNDEVLLVSVQPGNKRPSPVAPVQKTLTAFAGFQSAPRLQPRPPDSRALHSELSAQLKQKKATLSSVNISMLPDKGQRLLNQVKDLEDALESLSLSVAPESEGNKQDASGSEEGNRVPAPSQYNPFARSKGTILLPGPVLHPESQPSNLGLNFHSGPSSSQGYIQMYGVNSQQNALYGGRMTEDRLLVVRNATADAIDHLHKSLESCPATEKEVEDPKGLKVRLMPHQRQALAWLLWRETQKPCGGILADDMGLGKTLTMIALILAQKKKTDKKDIKLEGWISRNDSALVVSQGTLIICPASLIHHWKKEIERHVKGSKLSVYLYHGPNRQRNAEVLAEHDVVVTTYTLVSKEIPVEKEEAEKPSKDEEKVGSHQPPLLRVAWSRIVLDEGHNIKNPRVQTSMAVCKLRAGARWVVTGTPIQNNLLDMYALLKFLRCSPFDEYKLWKTQVDNGSKRGGERLNILTKTLLLRRTKDQLDSTGKPLVSLPERSCLIHRVKLSKDEQSVYDVLFAQSRSTLQSYLQRHEGGESKQTGNTKNPFNKVAQEFGTCQPGALSGSQSRSQSSASSTVHILSLLLRLRQCCCHLSLLKKVLDHTDLQNEGITLSLEEQLSAMSLAEPSSTDPKSTVSLNGSQFRSDLFDDTSESTKISAILTALKEIRRISDTHKSVIVSQWTSMLRIVALHLTRMGLCFATVDGSVNPKQRMDLVEEFNTNPKGPQVMLVSLCAGGVGINLVGGNHLFLMDMHWNPALEDQACDRIYRVGQLKDVTIHRFVCEGTVEDKISTLQEKKKELAKKVLSGTGDSFTKLTLADLKIIFGV